MEQQIISGDDVAMVIPLLDADGSPFVIDSAATVKAGIDSRNHLLLLLAANTLSEATPGSDWSASTVVATFTAEQTATLTSNSPAWIEIEILDTTKQTYFHPVKLVTGRV
jgi:hypothetical protein